MEWTFIWSLPRPVGTHCKNRKYAICSTPGAKEEHYHEHDDQDQREAFDEGNAEQDDAGDAQRAAGEHHLLRFCPKISGEIKDVESNMF